MGHGTWDTSYTSQKIGHGTWDKRHRTQDTEHRTQLTGDTEHNSGDTEHNSGDTGHRTRRDKTQLLCKHQASLKHLTSLMFKNVPRGNFVLRLP